MRISSILIRRDNALSSFLVLSALGSVIAFSLVPSGTRVWAYSDTAIVTAVAVTGPITAGLAAWSATALQLTDLGLLGRMAVRWRSAEGAQLLTLAAAAGAAYIAVCVLVSAWTATGATWGAPNLVWLAIGLAGTTAQAALGYLVGMRIRRRIVAPVVAVAFYALNAVLISVLNAVPQFTSLAFTNLQRLNPFFGVDLQLAGTQSLWLVAVAVAASAAVVARAVPRAVLLGALTVAVVAAAGAAGTVFSRPAQPLDYTVEVAASSCAGSAPVLCLHPAFRPARAAVARDLEQMSSRVAGTPFAFDRVVQTDRGVADVTPAGVPSLHLDDYSAGWQETAEMEMVQQMMDPRFETTWCRSGSEPAGLGSAATTAFEYWLVYGDDVGQLGLPDEVARGVDALASMPDASRRAWLAEHADALCTGSGVRLG